MSTLPDDSGNALEQAKKLKWRVTNWSEYDRALVQRGNLSLWFDAEYIEKNWTPEPNGKRGAQFKYSDVAIQMLLMLKALFHLPYRTLEGFARSLMHLMGLSLDVPEHTLMSRRSKKLRVVIPHHVKSEPQHIVVDSTGLKIYGEGEWKVRKHGASKHRRWIKVHLAVDAKEKDIVGVEVTTESWGDSEVFEALIDQTEGDIDQIDADGAYDTRGAYEVAARRGAKLVVPPRANAVKWEVGHPRNDVLDEIEEKGMAAWKSESGYHQRSLSENAMYRLKQLFGNQLASRLFETQVTEVHARIAVMNIITYLGMPKSVVVDSFA